MASGGSVVIGVLAAAFFASVDTGETVDRETGRLCATVVSYKTFIPQKYSKVGYTSYKTCCWRYFGVCFRNCEWKRSSIQFYYKHVVVRRLRKKVNCCAGWTLEKNGTTCSSPICENDCGNGTCVAPNLCGCEREGFRGSKCENDINECDLSPCKCNDGNPGCQSTCINTVGSYICNCNQGFALQPGGDLCADIDECQSDSCKCEGDNPDCEATCTNTIGSFTCQCSPGFSVQPGGHLCRDVDECELSPCEHSCVNIPGSYVCTCNKGFKKMSEYPSEPSCQDIDECDSNPCHCAPGMAGCVATCANTDGSYKCLCSSGFQLDPTTQECIDINECVFNNGECGQRCHNTNGSFTCSCRPGYQLHDDGFTCDALKCGLLVSPHNGEISCNGSDTNSVCRFRCNDGFERKGPPTRVCQSDSIWSGDTVLCLAKPCPPIDVPLHGSIVMPCVEFFESTCIKTCLPGYQLEGPSESKCVVVDGRTTWSPNNSTCKANTPCMPSPCLHSGRCSILQNTFTCDCSDTGYIGVTCNRGTVEISGHPRLTVNNRSDVINLRAKPEQYIEVVPYTENPRDAVFHPASVFIHSDKNDGYFSVTAKKQGRITIKYKLKGPDAETYDKPKYTILHASLRRQLLQPVLIDEALFETCQHYFHSTSCREASKIYIKSNCPWVLGTQGYVSVGKEDEQVPLSLNGMKMSSFANIYVTKSVSFRNEVETFLNTRANTTGCETCSAAPYDSRTTNFLVDNFYFQHRMLRRVSKPWPYWFDVRPGERSITLPENIKANFGAGRDVGKDGACAALPLTQGNPYVTYLPRMPLVFQALSVEKTFYRSVSAYCFAIDLCDDTVHVALPRSLSLDFTDNFRESGIDGFSFKITQLSLMNDSDCFPYARLKDVRCVKSGLRMRVEGDMRTTSARFVYDGFLHLDRKNLRKMMTTKFDTNYLLSFTGKVDYTINLPSHGDKLLISDSSATTETFIDIGGDVPSCPHSSKRGITMKLHGDSHSFRYDSSILRFKPTNGLRVHIPYHVNGGSVTSLTTVANLTTLLQPFKIMIPLLNREIWNIQKMYPFDQNIISQHSKKLAHALKKLSLVLRTDLVTNLEELISHLKTVKSIVFDFKSALMSFKARLYKDSQVHILLDGILRDTRKLREFKLDYLFTKIKLEDHGVSVSYTGDFCLYNLCLDNVTVSIKDYREINDCYVDNATEPRVYIAVTPENTLNLSARVWMTPDQKLELYLSRDNKEILGFADVSITFLNERYPARLRVENSSVSLAAAVHLHNGFAFRVANTVPLRSARWTTLLTRVAGECLSVGNFSVEMQKYFADTSRKTLIRKTALTEHAHNAYSNYKQKKVKLMILKELFEEARRKHLRASAIYIGAELLLTYKQKESKFYLEKQPDLKNIFLPSIENACTLKNCSATYVQIPFCEICKDEVIKVVNTLRCDDEKKLLYTRILVPFATYCSVINNTRIPIYSGSCPTNPARQSKLEKQFLGSNPSLRNLLDRNITRAVADTLQDINGLFLSCVKSHENITEKHAVWKPCMGIKEEFKTIKQHLSKCYYVKSRVQTNHTAPKKCNCRNNGYAVKISQTQCMLENNECELKRLVQFRKSTNIPKYFANLALSIYILKARVNIALIDVERQLKNKLFYRHQYDTTKSLLYNSRMESIAANKSKESVTRTMTEELCLTEKFVNNENLSDIFSIRSIHFNSILPVIKSVVMDVQIAWKVTKETVTIPILYDLDDRVMSIKDGVRIVIHSLLCSSSDKAGRRVRSVEQRRIVESSNSDDMLSWVYYSDESSPTSLQNNAANSAYPSDGQNITAWYHHNRRDVTKAQKACIDLEKAVDFLDLIASVLTNITHEAMALGEAIDRNDVMSSVPASNVTYANYQSIIKAQNELISSIESNIATLKKTAETASVLDEAREQLEVHISLNNYTGCFSFDDCVNTVFDTLLNLPTAFRVSRDQFVQSVLRTSEILQNVLAYFGDNLALFMYLIGSFKTQLKNTHSLCLHCSDKPAIKDIGGNHSVLEVMAGDRFTVNCSFASVLPVSVYWLRDDHVIDSGSKEVLTITASLYDSGNYKCLVVSQLGSAISNGTAVIVYSVPRMRTQPLDVRYLYPSHNVNATFVCNTTAVPKPDITWFFRPFATRNHTELTSERSRLLSITNPVQSKGGYYYCSAENKHGSVSSDEARLDVLHSNIAKQKISLSVNTKTLHSSVTFSKLEEMMSLHRGLNVTVKHKLDGNITKLHVKILLNPNQLRKLHARSIMIDLASLSRQDLAISSALFLSKVLNRSIESDSGASIEVYETSLKYKHNLNICERGHKLDVDGFTCVQCPAGTFGRKCELCYTGRYQPMPGQETCIHCPENSITKGRGSTTREDCYGVGSYCESRRPGQYRHPTSCTKYVLCKRGRTVVKVCEEGLYYDFVTRQCRWLFETPYELYVNHLRAWWSVCEW